MKDVKSGTGRKRILLVSQNFYPENFKSNDIAFELVNRGYVVDVLTGIPNYPQGRYFSGYGIFRRRIETVNGVKIYRIFQMPRGRKAGSVGLALNYFSFVFFASFWALFIALFRKYDAVFVHQTSPITQAQPAIIVRKIQKIPLYMWVLDLWPDAMFSNISVGIITRLTRRYTNYVYNNSSKILISSPGFEDLIRKNWAGTKEIVYYPNWCEDFHKMAQKSVALPLPDGFIIMMAGNLGEAQNFEIILKAALLLKDTPVKFVFIGDGSRRPYIEEFVKLNKLEKTVFLLGKYPFEYMPAIYSRADAMLLTLKAWKPHLRATVPARLQSYMSAGRPVLAMIDGGSADIINAANCGYAVPSDAVLEFVEIIKKKVLTNLDDFERLGANGRRYFESHFQKDLCINNLERIISE